MTECLILSARAEAYMAELANHRNPSVDAVACSTHEQALKNYAGQRVVFGDPDLVAPLLVQWPAVEWVQSSWAGVLPFVQEQRRDFVLTGVKGIFGEQMSEYVIGYMLAHELRVLERNKAQCDRTWYRQPSGTLQGKHIGIMGTGSIGQHIARTAGNFGMRVSGLSRSGAAVNGFDEVVSMDQRDSFLQPLDYLISTLPQTYETSNLLDEAAFQHLPAHACFINVGRSNVVSDDALVAALESGSLGGAVLDVFDEEPLPAESPLWTTPNLHITAHVSAASHPSLVVPIFVDNLRRYQQSRTLNYVIDLDKGY